MSALDQNHTKKCAIIPNKNNYEIPNNNRAPSKPKVSPNVRARKSLIPLLKALNSTLRNPNKPATTSPSSTSESSKKCFSSNTARPTLKGRCEQNATANATNCNCFSSKSPHLAVAPGIYFGPREKSVSKWHYRSIHSSVATRKSVAESIPSIEGLNLLPPKISERDRKNVLNWEIDDTLSINVSNPCPKLERSFSKFAVEIGKCAHRSREHFICPICNELFCKPAILACGHLFCIRCISGWFQGQDSCPCCRYPVVINESNFGLAKEFSEISNVLISTLNAGNLSACMEREIVDYLGSTSSTSDCLLSCDNSARLLNCIAPIFRDIFQRKQSKQNFVGVSERTKQDGQNNDSDKIRNSFIAAIWYLRHGLQLQYQHKLIARVKPGMGVPHDDAWFMENFPAATHQEAHQGSEASKKALVCKIMSLKILESVNGNLCINPLELTPSRRKLIHISDTAQEYQHQSHFRLRMPSSVGFTKMFMASFLFIVILLAVYLFDDHPKEDSELRDTQFITIDLFVFMITIFTLLVHTETERAAFVRRYRNGSFREGRRGRRQANDPIRIQNLFIS